MNADEINDRRYNFHVVAVDGFNFQITYISEYLVVIPLDDDEGKLRDATTCRRRLPILRKLKRPNPVLKSVRVSH